MKPSKYCTPEQRLTMRVEKTETGCWNWTGWKNPDGYGRVYLNGVKTTAHRASYILFKGNVPDGNEVHHICKSRLCINPAHLMVIERNKHRSQLHDSGSHNRQKTHCRNGHPYDSDNTRVNRDGSRACKTCEYENCKRWREENRSRYIENKRAYESERNPPNPKEPQTHCVNGHEFTPENTYHHPRGSRVCRTCLNASAKAYRERNPDKVTAVKNTRRQRQRANGEKIT